MGLLVGVNLLLHPQIRGRHLSIEPPPLSSRLLRNLLLR